ncbi:MAG: hypothetical protein L0Z62_02470 [Gemmataceae bacterium]|nr:hypothetical protein [Gemmataceae bacterium]
MGGLGSGRWSWHSKKTTVEGCRVLDLLWLARQGKVEAGRAGSIRWSQGEREIASVGYTIRHAAGGLLLLVSYRWSRAEGEGESVELPIRLETTRPRFGGVRWWGRCPLVVNKVACRRRVAKLYLPPRARYFGCRACHALTYRSAQTHDKRVDALRKNPELLAAIVANPGAALDGQLILAMKALG